MKIVSLGRPHQYMHPFIVLHKRNKKAADGMVLKSKETDTPDMIPDGILAEADEKTKERWKQNQHPITHTIVSYHPIVKVHEKDILKLEDSDRRFLVQGIGDPAGTGQFAIYYVLERRDINEPGCGRTV